MHRKGFTIVELLMVVGILGVLMTIVTTAATGAIKQARARRADALVAMVQSGIATYYAQNDEWPDFDPEGKRGSSSDNPDVYVLTNDESNRVVRKLVTKSVQDKNPLLDITGLFVADARNSINDRTYGMDFNTAIHGTKKHPKKLNQVSAMAFGYPDTETGRFRYFKMTYSIPADQLTVSKQ